jgi:hypothetical protein
MPFLSHNPHLFGFGHKIVNVAFTHLWPFHVGEINAPQNLIQPYQLQPQSVTIRFSWIA